MWIFNPTQMLLYEKKMILNNKIHIPHNCSWKSNEKYIKAKIHKITVIYFLNTSNHHCHLFTTFSTKLSSYVVDLFMNSSSSKANISKLQNLQKTRGDTRMNSFFWAKTFEGSGAVTFWGWPFVKTLTFSHYSFSSLFFLFLPFFFFPSFP